MKNRREIIFLYDVKDANPNGDPDEGNRPRIDPDGYNIVTDVRLKRTIRDYWIQKYNDEPGKKVLVKRVENPDGHGILNMGEIVKMELGIDIKKDVKKEKREEIVQRIHEEFPKKFIDIRFFGAAITLKNANTSFTGPVQFGIGRSLNKPTIKTYTITTTFSGKANTEEKANTEKEYNDQGTFGETNVVDYSIISFGGIISEATAKETGMSEDDLPLLWDGMWYGTKNLNTRSKFNHIPRLLLNIVSREKEFQIGGLYRLLSLEKDGIRDIEDVTIVMDRFIERLHEFKDSIAAVEVKEDTLLTFMFNGEKYESLVNLLETEGFDTRQLL